MRRINMLITSEQKFMLLDALDELAIREQRKGYPTDVKLIAALRDQFAQALSR